jgi:hypothetical protein
MNPILARTVCLALGLAALEALPGCASSKHGSEKEPELNPRVTGRTTFIKSSTGYRVALDVDVEQMEPYVEHGHTWTVHLWTGNSNTDVIEPGQLDWITATPWYAARPDLKAGRSEVEVDAMDYDVPRTPRYYVVVVQATERTGGEHPEVCTVVTHALAFDKAASYPKDVVIPRYGGSEPPKTGPQAP